MPPNNYEAGISPPAEIRTLNLALFVSACDRVHGHTWALALFGATRLFWSPKADCDRKLREQDSAIMTLEQKLEECLVCSKLRDEMARGPLRLLENLMSSHTATS